MAGPADTTPAVEQPPPPPYQPSESGQTDPAAQPRSPANQAEPIAMQPIGQPGMDPNGRRPDKVTPLHLLSERSEWVDCQFCHQRSQTRVESKGGGLQVVTGALLCLVCICLTPLPCCLHWFEKTNWYCQSCGKQIATRTPDTPVFVIPPPEALQVDSRFSQNGAPVAWGPNSAPPGAPPPHMNPMATGTPQSPPPPMSPPAVATPGQQQQPMSPPMQQAPAHPSQPDITPAPAQQGEAGPLPAKN